MKNLVNYLTLLACIFLTMSPTTTGCFITRKYTIHMVNKLPSPQLKLHCASKDNDLGYQTTSQNYDFSWTFCESFWSNTLFFCSLAWKNNHVTFDVFTSKKNALCFDGTCYYEIWEDGIYFAGGNAPRILQKKYDWQQ
ncbi:hypothetical protein ABFX02_06G187700 [Erythranthe guttata]